MSSPAEPTDHVDRALVAEHHPAHYLMHKYWARKPHNVVGEYVDRYTAPGEVVLDPFCGSGVAPIEALKRGRRAIGIDLSPVAIFVARTTARPVDVDAYEAAFERVAADVGPSIRALYATTCPACGEERPINKTIWRDGTPRTIEYECPDCATGRRRYREKEPDAADRERVDGIEAREIEPWYPDAELRYPDGSEFAKGEDNETVADLFTPRNLLAFARLFDRIRDVPDEEVRDLLTFTFTGSLHLGSKLIAARESAGGSAWLQPSFWTPEDFWENNVWRVFERRFERVREGKREIDGAIDDYAEADAPGELLAGDATVYWAAADARDALGEFPDDSVDYAFADPPYGGSVQYGELSFLWASWLGRGEAYVDRIAADEVTVNARQDKDDEAYVRLLEAIFAEVGRVTPRGSHATVTFHDPRFEVRNALERACHAAGYDLENVVWQPPPPVPSQKRNLQPYGSVSGDFYFRFRNAKRPGRRPDPDPDEFARVVTEVARETLVERGQPTPTSVVTNRIEPALAEHGLLPGGERSIADVVLDADEFVVLDADGEAVDRARTRKLTDKTLWLREPGERALDSVPLSERVEEAVYELLRREREVALPDVLRALYARFEDTLTPRRGPVQRLLEQYAERDSNGVWRATPSTRDGAREHDRVVDRLATAGRAAGYRVRVGASERSGDGGPAGRVESLAGVLPDGVSDPELERVADVDVLWIDDGRIRCAFEVEPTTAITGALARTAAIPHATESVVLVPDDAERLLARRLELPLVEERLSSGTWRFVLSGAFDAAYDEHGGEPPLAAIREVALDPVLRSDGRSSPGERRG